jgi:hypothetical protein
VDGGADELELAADPHPASASTPITAAARHPARAEARPPGGIAVTWTAPEFPASDVTDVPFGPAAPCAPCSNYDDIAWRPVGATRAWLTDAVPYLSPRRLRSLVAMRFLWRILINVRICRSPGSQRSGIRL